MNLNYISPVIINGEEVVEDVASDNNKWVPSTVIYEVGSAPQIGAMDRFTLEHGTFTTKPVILYHKDGYFVIIFVNEGERDRVLCLGPHYIM